MPEGLNVDSGKGDECEQEDHKEMVNCIFGRRGGICVLKQ